MLSSETTNNPNTDGDGTPRKSPQQSPRPPTQQDKQANPLEKIEQLLTCSICLDRYKNPKLLPCQHTYCLPCLDNYVDTIHHNLKCPECRSEHSIPFEGAKGFPTNLTLTGFLDIHLEATDDNSEEIEAYINRYNMERCKICDEKSELEICHHCDRKTCKECRTSHMEMLKRDLGRLLNQVRRLSNRIKEASDGVNKGIQQLDSNVQSTQNEVKDYFQRYQTELKKREEHFLGDVEVFGQNEKRLMQSVRDVLDAEQKNLADSCSWVESALNGGVEVKDEEFCRYKTVLADGVENLRGFQPDSEDMFSKKIRFSPGDDASKLPTAICNFGELTVSLPQFAGRYLPLEQQYLPKPLRLGLESDSYKTSYRTTMEDNAARMSKYKRPAEDYQQRARRLLQLDDDNSASSTRSMANRLRAGANDNGRVSPLNSNGTTNSSSTTNPNNPSSSLYSRSPFLTPTSNTSTITTEIEEPASVGSKNTATNDLLSRRQNRNSMVLPNVTTNGSSTSSELGKISQNSLNKEKQASVEDPSVVRLRQKPPLPRQQSSQDSNNGNGSRLSTPVLVESTSGGSRRRSLIIETTPNNTKSNNDTTVTTPTRRQKFKIICRSSSSNPMKRSDSADSLELTLPSSSQRPSGETQKDTGRSGSALTTIPNSSSSDYQNSAAACVAQTMARIRSQDQMNDAIVDSSPPPSTPTSRAAWMERRRQRFLRSRTNPDIFGSMDAADRAKLKASTNNYNQPNAALSARVQQLLTELDFKSAITVNSTTPRSPTTNGTSGNGNDLEQSVSRSCFSRRSSIVPDREISTERASSRPGRSSSTLMSIPLIDYGSKSKPRLVFGRRGDGPSEMNWPRGIASMSGGEFAVADSSNHRIQIFNKNGKLLRKFGEYGTGNGQLDSCAAIAYNRNKHQLVVTDRYNHRIQIFDLEGKFVKAFGGQGTENGKFKEPWGVALDELGLIYVVDKGNNRVQIFDQNGNFMSKFGSKGDGVGQFNSPLYIALHRRTQNIFISDSANNRVSVHDHDGVPILTFGIEGFHTGQLKLPRGLIIDDQGFVVVADSGNNRVQVFSPDGKFVHGFGTWGSSPGQLKGIEGVALMEPEHQIIVTDRENHRVQIF